MNLAALTFTGVNERTGDYETNMKSIWPLIRLLPNIP